MLTISADDVNFYPCSANRQGVPSTYSKFISARLSPKEGQVARTGEPPPTNTATRMVSPWNKSLVKNV